MKKTFKTLTFILAFTLVVLCGALLLCGCAASPASATAPDLTAPPPPETTSAGDLPDYGLTLSVENVRATGTGLTLVLTRGDSSYPEDLSFRNDYSLEYWDGNTWLRLVVPPYNQLDTVYGITNNSFTRMELRWPEEQAIPNGTYRLAEDCYTGDGAGKTPYRTYYSDPFEVTHSISPQGVKLLVLTGGTSWTIICYRLPTEGITEVYTDDSFWIEKQNGYTWEVVEPLNPYPFTGTPSAVPVNDTMTLRWQLNDFTLHTVYGGLPDGKYRIGKNFTAGQTDTFVFYDYFEIRQNNITDTCG